LPPYIEYNIIAEDLFGVYDGFSAGQGVETLCGSPGQAANKRTERCGSKWGSFGGERQSPNVETAL
jgi:hypothetical protein